MSCSNCNEALNKTKICEKCYNKPSFLDGFPKLKQEWDFEKNNDSKNHPWNLSKGSEKKVWWKCKKNHSFEMMIYSRTTQKYNCHYCSNRKMLEDGSNSLWGFFPKLRGEWMEENGDMKTFPPSSNKKVFWKCEKGHIFEATISHRTAIKPTGCPYCSNRKFFDNSSNSLWNTHSKLMNEWNFEKNNIINLDPKKISKGSGKKAWWTCKENHIFLAKINKRTRKHGSGCPYCCNRKMLEDGSNSVWFYHPELRDEWMEENGDMKTYPPSSSKKVFWKCEKGHVFKASVDSRTGVNKTGCPNCRFSKLEQASEKYFEEKEIKFQSQFKTDDCKNITHLPYDFRTNFKNTFSHIELQGQQHFLKNNYFNQKSKRSLLDIFKIDFKKCQYALLAKESYIAISYLCLDDISFVFNKFFSDIETNPYLIRFQLTKELFIDFNSNDDSSSNISSISLENDDILTIYQSYNFIIQNLKSEYIPTFIPCNLCERSYTSSLIQIHYHTEQHTNSNQEKLFELEEKYDNLFSVTEDGIPILIEQNDQED